MRCLTVFSATHGPSMMSSTHVGMSLGGAIRGGGGGRRRCASKNGESVFFLPPRFNDAYVQACNGMQWYDERVDSPIKEQDFRRDPPTSPPWRQQNPNCGFECDHDGGGNGDVAVGDLDCGGRSTRSTGGTGTMVGKGDLLGAAGSGGGEDDDTTVLRSLEKVLAKQSAKQRRRPSTEVQCA